MKYLAVGFWQEAGGGNTFTLSRPTDSFDCEEVLEMLCGEAHMDPENTDTILLIENGIEYPNVVEHWTGQNGDFDFGPSSDPNVGDEK